MSRTRACPVARRRAPPLTANQQPVQPRAVAAVETPFDVEATPRVAASMIAGQLACLQGGTK
jgi:hypothetical protein